MTRQQADAFHETTSTWWPEVRVRSRYTPGSFELGLKGICRPFRLAEGIQAASRLSDEKNVISLLSVDSDEVRRSTGRLFQVAGPATAKSLRPIVVLVCGTTSAPLFADRSCHLTNTRIVLSKNVSLLVIGGDQPIFMNYCFIWITGIGCAAQSLDSLRLNHF